MKRRLATLMTLFGLALALAGCDKCGGVEEIRYPTIPHACKGGPSR